MLRFCAYCGREKDENDFTDEHVIPVALGGNLSSGNPFLLKDVCGRCNSLCGLFVDGPFLRSWLTQNDRAAAALQGLSVGPSTILPLSYCGELREFAYADRICDFWLGPTRDSVYHFHRPYPEEPDSGFIVGRPPHVFRSEIDAGFVFLFIRSNNPIWWPCIFRSVVSEFWKKKVAEPAFYLGNGRAPDGIGFSKIPDEYRGLHQRLKGMYGKEHDAVFRSDEHQGERFLAKVALGLGILMLNNSFQTSRSAELLRDYLWQKEWLKRQQTGLQLTGWIGGDSRLSQFLEWPGGHILTLLNWNQMLFLNAHFLEMQAATMLISDQPEHWEGKVAEDDGTVYVISPGLQCFVGPKRLSAFIEYKLGSNSEATSAFRRLETRVRTSVLPPFDIA
jgi:HNH endonuclease